MDKTRTIVRIAGQELKIAGTESEDYIQKLASYVNKKIQDMQDAYPSVGTSYCILLATLNMADELHKLKADYEALDSRITELREMPRTPSAPVKRPFEVKQTVKTE